MNYTEILEKARKSDIDVLGLYIAYECNGQFTFDYTGKEFDSLCALVYSTFLASDTIAIWCIAWAINELIEEDNYTIRQVLDMNKYVLLDKASYYA